MVANTAKQKMINERQKLADKVAEGHRQLREKREMKSRLIQEIIVLTAETRRADYECKMLEEMIADEPN